MSFFVIIYIIMLPLLTESLWRDEAFSVMLAGKSLFQIVMLSTQDPSPPFYYFLLHFWMIFFGNSEVAVRLLSLLCHFGTVVIIFLIARKLFRSFYSQVAVAFITLINPFLLQYAFEARSYGLLVFLTIVALYLIQLKKNLLAGIFLALAMFTHNFGVPTFFIVTFWWLLDNRKKNNWHYFAKLIFFPVLLLFLWGGVILLQWSKFSGGFWIPKPTISSFISSFKIFSSGEISYAAKPILFLISYVLFLASILAVFLKTKVKKDSFIWLVTLLIFIPAFATFVFSQFFTPIYYSRYLILTTPMLILFIYYYLQRLLEIKFLKFILRIVFVVYLIFLVTSAFQVLSKTTKADVRSGVEKIVLKAESGDIIVPTNTLNFLEIKYYVLRSGKNIPVYAYSSSGKIPFYIGGILYEPKDIIKNLPKEKRIWQIFPNGKSELLIL